VLCRSSDVHRLLLAQPILRPQPLEKLETKVSPERFLDDLAVAFALPGRAHLHEAHDFLIERRRRSDFARIR
jgi:hypothetical protein